MTYDTLIFDREGHVGIVRLNRPERMNAVIEAMYHDLQAVLEVARDDAGIRALVLTGTVWKRGDGDKQAFCAGADLKKHAAGDRSPQQRRDYIRLAHETLHGLHEVSVPTLAAVNGPARGAGAEMALACDFLLMADTATLAFPETGLGTCVGGGVTRHLARTLGEMQAKHLMFTGEVVDGRGAEALGLALRSVPLERLLPEALALAELLADRAPVSLALVKRLIHRARDLDLRSVLEEEGDAILACMETRDWHEGIASFEEKRKPKYQGK